MVVGVAATVSPSAATSEATIADTAIAVSSLDGFDHNDQDFDILIQALLAADLVDAVADPSADLTVFAPTDRGFIRLAKDLGYKGNNEQVAFDTIVAALTELGDGDPIPVLRNVLLYHVSPGAVGYDDLRRTTTNLPTVLGPELHVTRRQIVDAAPKFRNPWIKSQLNDIETSNGVIHALNRVLLPVDIDPVSREVKSRTEPAPALETNIVETAIAVSSLDGFDHNKDDFDILIQSVLTADLTAALSNADANFTVFAPTDRAFVKLARDLGYTGVYNEEAAFNFLVGALTELGGGDPIPVLTDVLLYHVAPDAVSYSQLRNERTSLVSTLGGQSLRINTNQIVDAAPKRANAIIIKSLRDVNTSNGVIHGISRVLLPLDI
jgi:uncharacterized surface protein with fasciclin (FAS1) repeats